MKYLRKSHWRNLVVDLFKGRSGLRNNAANIGNALAILDIAMELPDTVITIGVDIKVNKQEMLLPHHWAILKEIAENQNIKSLAIESAQAINDENRGYPSP